MRVKQDKMRWLNYLILFVSFILFVLAVIFQILTEQADKHDIQTSYPIATLTSLGAILALFVVLSSCYLADKA
jgi:uncharacterized membrane protein YjfL (UPF0719 family)